METGTMKPLDIKPTEIKCGEVFCEQCGDCIYCYGENECMVDGPYHWYTWPKEEGDDY
jgi:hypothetical protein